jgi:hypothetical protein
MEHRYHPLLCQVLHAVGSRGPVTLLNANPEKTCRPVSEIWLSTEGYEDGQISRMRHTINTHWQYDDARTKMCVEKESDCNGQRIVVRVCDETRRAL